MSNYNPVPIYSALHRDELRAIVTEAIMAAIPAIIAAARQPDHEAISVAITRSLRLIDERNRTRAK